MVRSSRSFRNTLGKSAHSSLTLIKGALLCLFLIAAVDSYALEQPTYEVLFVDGDIEYRRYDAYLVAETAIAKVGDWGKDTRDGFMQLFDYISGENTLETKIAMTSPVVQGQSTKIAMTAPVVESSSEGQNRMAFMLPSKFNLDSAPRPKIRYYNQGNTGEDHCQHSLLGPLDRKERAEIQSQTRAASRRSRRRDNRRVFDGSLQRAVHTAFHAS